MTAWRKADGCESTQCVEVAYAYNEIGVRNSRIPLETIWFSPDEWAVFTDAVKRGEFDYVDQGKTG